MDNSISCSCCVQNWIDGRVELMLACQSRLPSRQARVLADTSKQAKGRLPTESAPRSHTNISTVFAKFSGSFGSVAVQAKQEYRLPLFPPPPLRLGRAASR